MMIAQLDILSRHSSDWHSTDTISCTQSLAFTMLSDPHSLLPTAYRAAVEVVKSPIMAEEASERAIYQLTLAMIEGTPPDVRGQPLDVRGQSPDARGAALAQYMQTFVI